MIHGAVTFEIFVMLRIVMIKIHVSHLLLRHTRSIKKADNVMHRDIVNRYQQMDQQTNWNQSFG